MPSHPTILVDNNALSHSELPDRVRGKAVYLADVVFYELFGAGKWERSITDALAPLAPFANHVVCTPHLGALLAAELATGVPTQSVDGDPVITSRLPALLRGCRDEPQRAIEYFRRTQYTVPPERSRRMANIPGYRDLAMDAIERTRAQLKTSDLARLINEPNRVADFIDQIDIWPSAVEGLRELPILGKLDCPNWNPVKMASVPCCWMRMLFCDLCHGVRRAVKENFSNTSDGDLHGDQNDREIVILATFADEFFSADRGAVWLERATRSCIRHLFKKTIEF